VERDKKRLPPMKKDQRASACGEKDVAAQGRKNGNYKGGEKEGQQTTRTTRLCIKEKIVVAASCQGGSSEITVIPRAPGIRKKGIPLRKFAFSGEKRTGGKTQR